MDLRDKQSEWSVQFRDGSPRHISSRPNPRSSLREHREGSRVQQFWVSGEGLERQILQEGVERFLGPATQCRRNVYSGQDGYLITAAKEFTPNQLENLQELSKIYQQARRTGVPPSEALIRAYGLSPEDSQRGGFADLRYPYESHSNNHQSNDEYSLVHRDSFGRLKDDESSHPPYPYGGSPHMPNTASRNVYGNRDFERRDDTQLPLYPYGGSPHVPNTASRNVYGNRDFERRDDTQLPMDPYGGSPHMPNTASRDDTQLPLDPYGGSLHMPNTGSRNEYGNRDLERRDDTRLSLDPYGDRSDKLTCKVCGRRIDTDTGALRLSLNDDTLNHVYICKNCHEKIGASLQRCNSKEQAVRATSSLAAGWAVGAWMAAKIITAYFENSQGR